MKYIDEVCSVLSDEVERRYLRSRDVWQTLTDEVSAVDERNGRITVMINIFGRPNPVELDHWHVENV